MKGKRSWVRFGVGVWMLVALTLVAGLPVLSQAAQDGREPGEPPLPPRPTPTVGPSADRAQPLAPPSGATIELRVPAALAGLWTMVQWQDGTGEWRDVQGWQGSFDAVSQGEGSKRWWVAQQDWGKGPFRWELCQEPTGAVLAASDPFYLPDAANQRVQVRVAGLSQEPGQGAGTGLAIGGGLPPTGGTRDTPRGRWMGLLVALVGLLALLGTPWCVVRGRRKRGG